MELLIAISVAMGYALLRAGCDQHIPNGDGKWKRWRFSEGVFWAVLTSLTLGWVFGLSVVEVAEIGLIYGLTFSVVFDLACGWHRTRNIFHLGMYGWDKKMTRIFRNGLNYFIFKMIWLTILLGAYTGFMIRI